MGFHKMGSNDFLNAAPESDLLMDSENLCSLNRDELMSCVLELQGEMLRLQVLLCHLLCKNEQLRYENYKNELSNSTNDRLPFVVQKRLDDRQA